MVIYIFFYVFKMFNFFSIEAFEFFLNLSHNRKNLGTVFLNVNKMIDCIKHMALL